MKPLNLVVAVAMTLLITLVTGPSLPALVFGAVLALGVAVGCYYGSAVSGAMELRPLDYALGAGVAMAAGLTLGGSRISAMWSVGAIIGIVVVMAWSAASRSGS